MNIHYNTSTSTVKVTMVNGFNNAKSSTKLSWCNIPICIILHAPSGAYTYISISVRPACYILCHHTMVGIRVTQYIPSCVSSCDTHKWISYLVELWWGCWIQGRTRMLFSWTEIVLNWTYIFSLVWALKNHVKPNICCWLNS